MISVPAIDCISESLSLNMSDAFRMVIPYRVGAGIPNSALLSTPVVLNNSGEATLLICNRSDSTFSTTSSVVLDYVLS